MVVSHVINSLDKSHGGPSYSAFNLCDTLSRNNPEIKVLLQTYQSPEPLVRSVDRPNFSIRFSDQTSGQGTMGFFKNDLVAEGVEVFHGHGIWQPPIYYMGRMAQKRGIPYTISIRGMLDPWALGEQSLKKKIAMALYQRSSLQAANCIHATSDLEADQIRNMGFTNPVAIIPNGLNLKDISVSDTNAPREKRVLLLSRLHEKKGIDILIDAWHLLGDSLRQDWKLDIVGNGEEDYVNAIKAQIASLGLSDNVFVKPPVYGDEKKAIFKSTGLFVLPTRGENFGNVIAEALAAGTPVITTKKAPWQVLEKEDAGWWIDLGVKPLVEALTHAMELSSEERARMGENGKRLVEENYYIDNVSRMFLEMYEWLTFKTEKPEFIID